MLRPLSLRYVARIRAVAAGDAPALLVGHLYSRYVGDLFGGQMMAGMAAKSLGLDARAPGGGGLAFYTFDAIPDTRAFIDRWYRALNALELAPAARAAIVDEANAVFALNIDVTIRRAARARSVGEEAQAPSPAGVRRDRGQRGARGVGVRRRERRRRAPRARDGLARGRAPRAVVARRARVGWWVRGRVTQSVNASSF